MSRSGIWLIAGALLALAGPSAGAGRGSNPHPYLRLVGTVPLPNVEGRIDHLAIDPGGHRLFVAALGSRSVEVVDLVSRRSVRSLRGLGVPQGAAYLAHEKLLVIADGETGKLFYFGGRALARVDSLDLGDDADNLRVDAAHGLLCAGFGDGGIALVGIPNRKLLGSVALPGHPEAFAVSADGRRLFVNVPGERAVVPIDLPGRKTLGRWRLSQAGANFPMALAEEKGRLLVGCRQPPMLLSLDVATGRCDQSLGLDGDVDDVWWDPASERVYASCGAGFVDVFAWPRGRGLSRVARVPTAPGTRTCLFAAGERRLYVAVPHRGGQRAEIRVFQALP